MNPAPALAPAPLERCQGAFHGIDQFSFEGRSASPTKYAGEAVMASDPNARVRVVFQKFDHKRAVDLVATVIETEFANSNSVAKTVARHTAGEASHRTVETWSRRQSAPSLAAFLNMLVGPNPIPALQATVRALLSAGETDPDFQKSVHDLIRQKDQP